MKCLRAALLVVIELSELVIEAALIVSTAHDIVQSMMAVSPQEDKKPEERRWVN